MKKDAARRAACPALSACRTSVEEHRSASPLLGSGTVTGGTTLPLTLPTVLQLPNFASVPVAGSN